MLWYNKSRRAQSDTDFETWVEGGVVPTLNAFDNGDVRATTIIAIPIHDKATRSTGKRKLHNGEYVMDGAGNGLGIGDDGDPMNTLTGGDRHAVLVRMREGKPGGGKGPLLSEDKSLTIATNNDQTLFVFHPHRSDGVRLQGETVNTLTAFMGTGGLNTPMLAFSHTQGLDIQASEKATPTLRREGNGMAAQIESVVRRLTPTECERLQGFPDGWTDIQSDTHRYKQMGNAVAVPVVEWLVSNLVENC